MSQSSTNDPKDGSGPEMAAPEGTGKDTLTAEDAEVIEEVVDASTDDARADEKPSQEGDGAESQTTSEITEAETQPTSETVESETQTTSETAETESQMRTEAQEQERVETTTERDDRHEAHADDDGHHGSSFASTALKVLIAAIVIFAIAIWALPRIAPHLPDSMAKHLFPAQQVIDQRLAAIEAQVAEGAKEEIAALEAVIADLTARLEVAEASTAAAAVAAQEAAVAAQNSSVSDEALSSASEAAARAAAAAEVATSAVTEAGTVASSAMRNNEALAGRVSAVEAQLTSLSDELGALGAALANNGTTGADGVASPELAAAYNALKARVDGLASQIGGTNYVSEADASTFVTQNDLRATRTALEASLVGALAAMPAPDDVATNASLTTAVADLGARLDAVEAAAADATEVASTAQAEVGGAIRSASLRSAIAALNAQMLSGIPFAAPLEEVARLADTAPPEALSAVAADGVATPDELLAGYGRVAQEAIAADLRAQADGNFFGQATARLRSVVAGRPEGAQEGETVPAILSRIEAAVQSGELSGALAETDTLPEAAQTAMGPWISKLRARVEADAAMTDYVAGIGGSQG